MATRSLHAADPSNERAGHRVRVAILLGATALTFWLLMMCVHEIGHAAAAWLTGGRVVHVELSPLGLSRTDVSPNPRPGVVAWGGPAFGATGPLLLAGTCRLRCGLARRLPRRWIVAFAGFCLIANGLYLASGMVFPAGDTEDLLRRGTPAWILGAIGIPVTMAGGLLWHSLGPLWGLGTIADRRRTRSAGAAVALLLAIAGVMQLARVLLA